MGEEEQTNAHVSQHSLVCEHSAMPAHLWKYLQQAKQENKDWKVIVFFPTARSSSTTRSSSRSSGFR